MDATTQRQIERTARWLAYYAGQLRAAIGAHDPHDYTGWQRELDRAELDIAEIRRRAERHEVKHMEAAE